MIFIYIVLNYTGSMIDLASESIISIYLFYPITFAGIYISLWIAKVISKLKQLTNIFSFIGKYSFDIMALHFLSFKLIDLIYVHILNLPIIELGRFPITNSSIWPIYVIGGIAIPIFFRVLYTYLKRGLFILFLKIKPKNYRKYLSIEILTKIK